MITNKEISLNCLKAASKCSEIGRIMFCDKGHYSLGGFMLNRAVDLVKLSLVFYEWNKKEER